MAGAAGFASCVLHFCQELEEFWAYQELLEPFARRLSSCCSPELLPLLELPGVQVRRLPCHNHGCPSCFIRNFPN